VPVVPASVLVRRRWFAILGSIALLALAIDRAFALPLPESGGRLPVPFAGVTTGHLVVSELMTGGASASDEFIELYNPTAATLPLEGLEVVYVTASGATVTRKAAWSTGAPGVPGGAHLLIANGAGVFAAIGDATYASGLAATGGSVALRVQGAATAIDALGWGNATSAWLESRPAPAPAAGSSIERLPGGSSGSGQDTDDNLVDFATLSAPDPQNSGSPPIPVATASPAPTATPAASPTPQPSATPTAEPTMAPTIAPTATPLATPSPTPIPTPSPTPTPTVTPTPTPTLTATPTPAISVAAARALPDGSVVTVEALALTPSDFTDGGGYVADTTAGITVLVSGGSFSRGQLLRVTGTLDDRYAQRTIRALADAIVVVGVGSEPLPTDVETGSIGEGSEGSLVELTGVISSSATTLSAGIAWDLDDGSGPIRILVGSSTGIDTAGWTRGTGLTLIGVVGQRDSSGSGTAGFRVQPRDAADILAVEPIATPTPTPPPTPTPAATPSPAPTATPSPSASSTPVASATPVNVALVSIGEARSAATGTHLRIRGVVTAQSDLLEASSAVVQDMTAGILVRLGSDAGRLALGEYVELEGTRSAKAGMLTLRVTRPALRLGRHADPDPLRKATGAMGEAEEARLVVARGAVTSPVSRAHGGSVSFAIDDGSGPLRVTISARAGIATGSVKRGAWLELRGVLGQQTTGKAPLAGYRLWPRISADLRVISAPVAGSTSTTSCCGSVSPTKQRQVTDVPLADTALGDGIPGTSLAPPTVAQAHPTSSPASVITATSREAPGSNGEPRMAGLVVSGMGLAVMAALAARFLRRRPDAKPPSAEHGLAGADSGAPSVTPHLSLLRAEAGDAQEEQRILPPI
jgi:hypothetical protein